MIDLGQTVTKSESPGVRRRWRPVAYVAVVDVERRRSISKVLGRDGWLVIDLPSGYHLVEDIADVLLGEQALLRPPDLVVVDVASPGCSGITIARGLRDLGWSVPIVLLGAPESSDGPDPRPGGAFAVLPADAAPDQILELLGRHLSPERAVNAASSTPVRRATHGGWMVASTPPWSRGDAKPAGRAPTR